MPKIVPDELYWYEACERPAYELRDGTVIPDRLLDSRRIRSRKGHRGLTTLQRLYGPAWNVTTGRAELVTLLITFPRLDGKNVWQRALILKVKAMIDTYFKALASVAGCAPIPYRPKVEVSLGRNGLIHAHVVTTEGGGKTYTDFAGHPDLEVASFGMKHHYVWAVAPQNHFNTVAYLAKPPDGRVLQYRFFEREVDDYEAGVQAAMADCAAAQQIDRAEGRQRLTSQTWFRNMPWRQPKLTRWERKALVAMARGTAMPGMTFEEALKVLAEQLEQQDEHKRASRRVTVQPETTSPALIPEVQSATLPPTSAAPDSAHPPVMLLEQLEQQDEHDQAYWRATDQPKTTSPALIPEVQSTTLPPTSAAPEGAHPSGLPLQIIQPECLCQPAGPRPACPCESARARAPPGHHRPFALFPASEGDARPPCTLQPSICQGETDDLVVTVATG